METPTTRAQAAVPATGTGTGADGPPGTPERQPAPSRQADQRSQLEELCARRGAGEQLPAAARPLDLSGLRLVGADLSGLDLSGCDLTGAELLNCDLRGSRLVGARLVDALLADADLTNAELLSADVSGADFSNAKLDRAGFGQVTGTRTLFFGATGVGATFSSADLTGADFRACRLEGTRLVGATLRDAVFSAAGLVEVDLTGADVAGANFHDADLSGARLRNISGYREADWINAGIHDVDFTGAWLVRRHVQDENYLHEFRSQSPAHERLYRIWRLTSDCGRSLWRWSLWTVLVALIYAVAYTQVSIDWGDHETPLSPVYYSVVTFTTLGYGDVLPGSTAAQVLAMSEVILGYFSLGGMMSILSDKMARRAG